MPIGRRCSCRVILSGAGRQRARGMPAESWSMARRPSKLAALIMTDINLHRQLQPRRAPLDHRRETSERPARVIRTHRERTNSEREVTAAAPADVQRRLRAQLRRGRSPLRGRRVKNSSTTRPSSSALEFGDDFLNRTSFSPRHLNFDIERAAARRDDLNRGESRMLHPIDGRRAGKLRLNQTDIEVGNSGIYCGDGRAMPGCV